jgi:hypothetical protein
MKKVIFFLLTLLIFFSCHKKNNEVPVLTGVEYFPTDSGRYWIYNVHSIQYNSDTIDTTFQVKEVIYDTFHYQNVVVYELYRFYRPDSTYAWPLQPDSVWSFTTDQNEITIKQASAEFIVLDFPLSNGKTWNGNAKNTSLEDDYIVKNLGQPFSAGKYYFSATCNVEESQSLNLVNKDYRNRIYAKGIGLVYKKYEFLSYNTSAQYIGQYLIDYGSVIEETLTGYGTP